MAETAEDIAVEWRRYDIERDIRRQVAETWNAAYFKAKRKGCDIMWAHHEADRAVERLQNDGRARPQMRQAPRTLAVVTPEGESK